MKELTALLNLVRDFEAHWFSFTCETTHARLQQAHARWGLADECPVA